MTDVAEVDSSPVQFEGMTLYLGECIKVLAGMPENSVDAVVCDPPYGLSFMGKEWDRFGTDTGHGYTEKPRWKSDPLGGGAPLPNHYEGGRAFQAWCQAWAEAVLRVLKPGGFMLAAGGSRTYHRLVCAVEDVGFEVRDTICHHFGSGFPKSLNVSVAIDKAAGAQREVVGSKRGVGGENLNDIVRGSEVRTTDDEGGKGLGAYGVGATQVPVDVPITAPATPEAKKWEGWGTALKPASEFWTLARKPIEKTVAANVLKWGTGALNIDACRVRTAAGETIEMPSDSGIIVGGNSNVGVSEGYDRPWKTDEEALARRRVAAQIAIDKANDLGRWPANVVLSHAEGCRQVGERECGTGERSAAGPGAQPFTDERGWNQHSMTRDGAVAPENYGAEIVPAFECEPGCPVAELDEQTGVLTSGAGPNYMRRSAAENEGNTSTAFGAECRPEGTENVVYGDAGGGSRFFPVFPADHDPLDGIAPFRYQAKPPRAERNAGLDGMVNSHPTCKSVALMKWLIRLVTPPDGVILDCFLGSGTTGVAAVAEGVKFIGIEREPDYFAIAQARIAHAVAQKAAEPPRLFDMEPVERKPRPAPAAPPPTLF